MILSDFGVSRLFPGNLRRDVDAATTMITEAQPGARLVMGTRGYMAPEVARGDEATPAADSYSLGVMFVYLLTGIWYEPASKVFKLLDALEYRWGDVLPRLLAENPAERPTDLTALARRLSDSPTQAKTVIATKIRPSLHRKTVWLSIACAAAVVAGVVLGVGLWIGGESGNSFSEENFIEAFSDCGIYEAFKP